jgi:hypothetical protein
MPAKPKEELAPKTWKRKPPIAKWFTSWLSARDTATSFKEHQEETRIDLLDAVLQFGEEDDKGNVFYDLDEVAEFKDRNGKTFRYDSLKREKYFVPAQPLPDPELAEALLRKKKLWLTAAQEKFIKDLAVTFPYGSVTVDIDPDAVGKALIAGLITEKEYVSILAPQAERYRFIPQEA